MIGGIPLALVLGMTDPRTDQPAPHAGEHEKGAGVTAHPAPQPTPKDAKSPASKPQGTLDDQVTTMESEGQAQPQAGDQTPDQLERDGFPKPHV